MVITRLIGGLGNQMFQYAFGRRVASHHHVPLKLDISGFETYKLQRYSLGNFNIAEKIASQEEISKLRGRPNKGALARVSKLMQRVRAYGPRTYLAERSFQFDPKALRVSGDVYLDGYWQSEKYFKEIEDLLRNEFTVRTEPDDANASLLERIMGAHAVSLHIRRGDYVSNPITQSIHGTLHMDYYVSAMRFLAEQIEDPHFFVFSDDPEWARGNLKSKFPIKFVTNNDADTNYEDLRLMSSCKHHIIANSSFSWWAAWLCSNPEKLVFAPRKWFEGSDRDTRDLIPGTWNRI